jgi:hypothetical protein
MLHVACCMLHTAWRVLSVACHRKLAALVLNPDFLLSSDVTDDMLTRFLGEEQARACLPSFCKPSPDADVARVSAVPVQLWEGEPSPGADVDGGKPSPGADVTRDMLYVVRCSLQPRGNLFAPRREVATWQGARHTMLQRPRARWMPCAEGDSSAAASALGLGSAPATSAPGLGWAHPGHICVRTGLAPVHICIRTGLTPAASAPGLGSSLRHLQRDWGSPLPHLHRTEGCNKSGRCQHATNAMQRRMSCAVGW